MGNAIAPMVYLKNQNSNNNARAQNIDNVHLKEKTVAIMKTNKIVKHLRLFLKDRELYFLMIIKMKVTGLLLPYSARFHKPVRRTKQCKGVR